jgi:hypothetical protein
VAGIGGVTCDFVKGTSKPLRQALDVWTVPGVNGVGALKLGFQDSEFRFVCVLYDTHANVVTWSGNLGALQGQIVSAVDDQGATHSNLLVVSVSPVQRTAVRGAGGSIDTRGEVLVEGRVTA